MRHFYNQFWLKIRQSGFQAHVDAICEHHLIDFQAQTLVLKDFASKFGTRFFTYFGYKINAPKFIEILRGPLMVFEKGPLKIPFSPKIVPMHRLPGYGSGLACQIPRKPMHLHPGNGHLQSLGEQGIFKGPFSKTIKGPFNISIHFQNSKLRV